ncbi:MAG TPA: aminoacetone oxidase family FAD-binding enzyme [Planctomycetota bacterium]|nr:aminoacetone oxidase family FAD-binding enzyme [Planctomycetota bacterium]
MSDSTSSSEPRVPGDHALDPGSTPWPVAVVGAGAAGILAAIFAARRGARVLLLETRPVPGAKIRVSGGGRCNVLPSKASLEDFHTGGSVHALRNILFSWPLEEVRAFFEVELSIPLKVEATGKVFPVSDRSQDVVAALLAECRRAGVTLAGGSRVVRAAAIDGPDGRTFQVETEGGPGIRCRRLVLATGGLSLPRTGSDGGGLEIARSLGHSVNATYPALVPLVATDPGWGTLAGVSLRVGLRAVRDGRVLEEREGDFLFTHRGFSGPVALDMSRHVARPGGEATRLLAAWGGSTAPAWDDLLRAPGKRTTAHVLRASLPRRLVERLLTLAAIPEARLTSVLRREERVRLVEVLASSPLAITGNEGYAVAEVTGGGIPLEEVTPRTLESRKTPGLHLAGEMLDTIGQIGGYNFLWAWVSGRRAGEGAAGACAQGGR